MNVRNYGCIEKNNIHGLTKQKIYSKTKNQDIIFEFLISRLISNKSLLLTGNEEMLRTFSLS